MHTQFLLPDSPVRLAKYGREKSRCFVIEILLLEGNMGSREEAFTKLLSE